MAEQNHNVPPACSGCGRTLAIDEKSGVTMCPTEDAITLDEARGSTPKIVLDGTIISDPFTPLGRNNGAFDSAHDAHFARLVKETYGDQKL